MSDERQRRIDARDAVERRAANPRLGRPHYRDPLEGTGKGGDPKLEPRHPDEEAEYMAEAFHLGGRGEHD